MVAGHIGQVVILYRYRMDCVGIGLGRLNVGCLRQVVVLQRWPFNQV